MTEKQKAVGFVLILLVAIALKLFVSPAVLPVIMAGASASLALLWHRRNLLFACSAVVVLACLLNLIAMVAANTQIEMDHARWQLR